MKLYHICQYCHQYYHIEQTAEGAPGAFEVRGICEDCARLHGVNGQMILHTHYH